MTANDSIARKKAYQSLAFQAAIGVVMAIVFAILQGISAGYSALLGALCACLPSLAFILFVFRRKHLHNTQPSVSPFFKAEAIKFILIAILFIAILRFIPITAMSFLLTFIVTQCSALVFPLFSRQTTLVKAS